MITADGLVGRGSVLAAADVVADAVRVQGGRVVLVEGPAGYGKTAFLGRLSAHWRQSDFHVMECRASRLERDYPLAVIEQLLRSAVRAGFESARELVERLSKATSDSPIESMSFARELYLTLEQATADRPAVLMIDDAQWADDASLHALRYLAQRAATSSVLLVIAQRPQRADVSLLHTELVALATETLVMGALDADAISEMMRAHTGAELSAEVAEKLHRATGGSPFLVSELIDGLRAEHGQISEEEVSRALVGFAPMGLHRRISQRIETAGPTANAIAEAVATLGSDATVRLVAQMTGQSQTDVLQVASQLARLQVFAADRLAFAHDLVRVAVEAGRTEFDRALAHQRAAQLLMAEGSDAEHVVRHLLNTPPEQSDAVVEILLTAAESSSRRGGFPRSVQLLRRAMEEGAPASAGLLPQLGVAEMQAYDPAALAHLYEVLDAVTEPEAIVTFAMMASFAEWQRGGWVTSLSALRRGCERLEPDTILWQRLMSERMMQQSFVPVADREPLGIDRAALARLPGATAEQRAIHAALAIDLSATDGRVDVVAEHCRVALSQGLALELASPDLALHSVLVEIMLRTDEFELLDNGIDAARRDYGARISPRSELMLFGVKAGIAERRGDLTRAMGELVPAIGLLEEPGGVRGDLQSVAHFASMAIPVALHRGDPAALDDLVQLLDEVTPGARHHYMARAAFAAVHLEAGRVEEAVEVSRECAADEQAGLLVGPTRWRLAAAIAHAQSGDGATARELADQAVTQARHWGMATEVGAALRTRALVGDDTSRVDALAEAVAVLAEPLASPYELALTELHLGAALRRAGRVESGRDLLRQALARADRIGALGLRSQVMNELRLAGARPRRAATSGAESLTAAERRVAELAGGGMTNVAIARSLFITIKTVETHLSSTFRKLQITNRTQLAGALELDSRAS